MDGECTDDFFVYDGSLLPVAKFSDCFIITTKYIYEVLRVQQGVPLFIEDHMERLWKTAALEELNLPFNKEEILADISQLILKNYKAEGNIKIFISLLAENPISRIIYFTPHVYPSLMQFAKGVQVGLFEAERNNPNAKVMDVLLRNATEVAKRKDNAYEVLLVDRDSNITEGSRSNVFSIHRDTLITPPVYTVLEGITRKQIMYLCAKNNISVLEREINVEQLHEMEAVFITGTSRRILPVNRIGEHVFNVNHPLVRNLQSLFDKHVQAYMAGHRSPIIGPVPVH